MPLPADINRKTRRLVVLAQQIQDDIIAGPILHAQLPNAAARSALAATIALNVSVSLWCKDLANVHVPKPA